MKVDSVTKFLKLKDQIMSSEDLEKKHPEFATPKLTYYLFGKKIETYVKNGEEKNYE